jgi:hypothetical protein
VASLDPNALKVDSNVVYRSKIANVPTPGYSGHTSIFIKPVGYLNKDQILIEEEKVPSINDDNQFAHVLNASKTNNNEVAIS